MVCSRSLTELNPFGIRIEGNQRLSQNGPLDFGNATDKEVPAQGAAARNVTSEQASDELDGLWVCFFKLDNVSNETIERFDGLLVEQGVEALRELNPVLGCPSVCGGYQGSVKAVERWCELA